MKKDAQEKPPKEVAEVTTNKYSFNPEVRLLVKLWFKMELKTATDKHVLIIHIDICLLNSRFKALLYIRNQPFAD